MQNANSCLFQIHFYLPFFSHPPPGWVRGPGQQGGDSSTGSLTAPALCDGSDDVGLELLVLFFQEKRTEKLTLSPPNNHSNQTSSHIEGQT